MKIVLVVIGTKATIAIVARAMTATNVPHVTDRLNSITNAQRRPPR